MNSIGTELTTPLLELQCRASQQLSAYAYQLRLPMDIWRFLNLLIPTQGFEI